MTGSGLVSAMEGFSLVENDWYGCLLRLDPSASREREREREREERERARARERERQWFSSRYAMRQRIS